MLKRLRNGSKGPVLTYERLITAKPAPLTVPAAEALTLMYRKPEGNAATLLQRPGDTVKTFERIQLFKENETAMVAPVTGRVTAVGAHTGDFGRTFATISITAEPSEIVDDGFKAPADGALDLETARQYLSYLPGDPGFERLDDTQKPIHTIIITGLDNDLCVITNQYVLLTRKRAIRKGVACLKTMAGVEKIYIAAPWHLMQEAGDTGAEPIAVSDRYPDAAPTLLVNQIRPEPLPAGKSPEDAGFALMSAEAVAALGEVALSGRIPDRKIVTLVHKDGTRLLLDVQIGTPIGAILAHLKVSLNHGDRVIVGGPMRGAAIPALDLPVMPATDAIILQDCADLSLSSDYPCINCGECIRICPAHVPVNMLVRFLEAGKYQDGADIYDLFSCIECALCSLVCIAHIPIFQYIRLAKYELARIEAAEADHA